MSYRKATDILPIEILQVIQEYVDGDYLYIPKRKRILKNGVQIQKLKSIQCKEIKKSLKNMYKDIQLFN